MTGVVELFNAGDVEQPLDGWQFCTHNVSATFQYSAPSGLNGFTVEAGTSFFVHVSDDAPGGPNSVNLSTVAPNFSQFALPMDATAYGMAIYFPPIVNFTDGAQLADYLQWSLGGVPVASVAGREDLAEAEGLWEVDEWILTTSRSQRIDLVGNVGAEDHGALDYSTTEAPPTMFRRGDVDDDGGFTIADPLAIFFVVILGSITPTCDEAVDADNNAMPSVFDGILLLRYLFLAGPPPADPGPINCGVDPDALESAGDLGCDEYTSC